MLSLAAAAFFALTGWLRLSEALRNFSYLRGIGLYPDPRYLAISGGIRGLLFTAAFVFILVRSTAAPLITRLSCAIYTGWLWTDRIWIGRREAFHFYLTSTILFSVLTLLFAFVLIQPRDYRKERKDEPETGTGS